MTISDDDSDDDDSDVEESEDDEDEDGTHESNYGGPLSSDVLLRVGVCGG